MPTSALGSFIQEELEHRGWTQRDLEIHSGVSDSTIHRIMNGSSPKLEPLYRIAQALGVPLSRLLTVAGYPVDPLPDTTAQAQRIAEITDALPWVAGVVDDLTRLTPEQRETLIAYLEVLKRRRLDEEG
jgi:transcriptional regulator with XRE-family HTH domain